MKKFLEDLEKELKKLNIEETEIAEILADHKEMIENGKAEGLEESDMTNKFGDPEKIAKDIFDDSKEMAKYSGSFAVVEDCTSSILEEGYKEFKSFNLDELDEININLVSDDVIIKTHSDNKIIIIEKGVKDITKYSASMENNKFDFHIEKGFKLFTITRNGGSFIIKIPETALLKEYLVKNISGDIIANNINTGYLKLKTISGDFKLSNVKAKTFDFTTVSGDAEIDNLSVTTINTNLVSGDLELSKAIIEGNIEINSVSGEIKITKGQCENLKFKSVSGDFNGEEFYPKTASLSSVSGDITIDNEDKSKEIEITHEKSISGKIKVS